MSEIEMPLDSQGFLRRECPACQREFKWHHGPIEGGPVEDLPSEEYFCPYCGEAASLDQWWTTEQVEAIQQMALHDAMPRVEQDLRDSLKNLDKSGFLKTEVKADPVNPPAPMFEPDDMTPVASPCHPYEPVKIADDWTGPIHCLVCGAPYAL
jgi:Zn ribbon nucleic-acid-binding protein